MRPCAARQRCCGQTTLRDAFTELVRAKRIDVVNGGFVQHDEALTSLRGALIQLTLGAQFLRDALQHSPRVGYHIDPVSDAAGLCTSGH